MCLHSSFLPTALLPPKRPSCNANLILLLLGVKALSDSWPGKLLCFSVTASSFVPLTIHLVTATQASEALLYPCLSKCRRPPSLPHPPLHLFLQEMFLDSPSLSLLIPLCCHTALFMRPVSLGLSSLLDFELQIFYSCGILLSGTVLNFIDATGFKTDKIPVLMELLLPKGERQ